MPAITRNPQKIWRVIDLIKWGEEYFFENSFENPRKEIEILLQNILSCSRVDLYLRFEEPLAVIKLKKLRDWVTRRKNHEPVQYITGNAGFYNLVIKVTPNVLIPRPESERVVELVIESVGFNSSVSILDIGSGSGCLALALGKELPKANIIGIDNSEKAIEVAKLNAEKLQIRNVKFYQLDLLKDNMVDKFDIVISNPPYIPENDIEALMSDVKDFEPLSALTDSNDGLTFYHKIIEEYKSFTHQGTQIFLEVGLDDHPIKVLNLFSIGKFDNVELIKDYNGDNRVLMAQVK